MNSSLHAPGREKHFTVTTYILSDLTPSRHFFLLFHPKLNKWLPPGGHLEKDESPPDGAKREVLEESGLEVTLLQQENIWIDRWNAKSFERPFLCLEEIMPAHGTYKEHLHLDLIYVGLPKERTDPKHFPPSYKFLDENREKGGWFSHEEIEKLQGDVEIFEETKQILRVIKEHPFVLPS